MDTGHWSHSCFSDNACFVGEMRFRLGERYMVPVSIRIEDEVWIGLTVRGLCSGFELELGIS
jgi:hypothetical protein